MFDRCYGMGWGLAFVAWTLSGCGSGVGPGEDWRVGPVVYQVFVDRFAPPADLASKRHLYPAPKRLRGWEEQPTPGDYLPAEQIWSHEVDFWGGDLRSLRGKLDYLQSLGVEVVYLNPIHAAYSNHKYDASDLAAVSPEYGTRADLRALAADLHGRGMRMVLDGVFNHTGRRSAWFESALADARSAYRDFYVIGPEYKLGYRAWRDVANLPELNLENAAVRRTLWGGRGAVVQGWMADGVDGWRIDVATDLGFAVLDELTRAVHRYRPDGLVVGEVWAYPGQWCGVMDGVLNMHARYIMLDVARGWMSGARAGRLLAEAIDDAGLAAMQRSWLVLDNHDTPRLASVLSRPEQRRIAQVMQCTLPGAPCLYYGVEVGMEGESDPRMRGPMRWDLAVPSNPEFAWTCELLRIRRENPALRRGEFRRLETDHLLAFLRRTERIEETVLVVVNGSIETRGEQISLCDSRLVGETRLRDLLSEVEVSVHSGMVWMELPACSARILRPVIEETAARAGARNPTPSGYAAGPRSEK